MAEYIERQAVLDALQAPEICNITPRHIELIKQIPSAEVAPVRRGRWIKCKTRLPEKYEDVLMLFDNGKETNMAVGFLTGVDEHVTFWCAYSDCGWYTDCDDSPVYWMPLPLPPKAVRTDN